MQKYNIYITRFLELKREGNLLKIDNKKIPLSMVKNVYVIGNSKITKSAKNLLLKHNRAIFYFTSSYQLNSIQTPPTFKSNYRLRLKQYQNFQNLDLAKFIVYKKIQAIQEYAQRSLQRHINRLQETKSLNEILGVEGIASTYMFSKLKQNLSKHNIPFEKREYRPVKDPVNSLLSFLYTLYYSFLYAEVIAEGFDPYIGFLHIKRGTHAAFVSDMMEEARVYLTALAYEILTEIYPDGFEGVYLSKEGRKYLLKRFDNFIQNYENTLLSEFKEKL